jgi:hypothetical protein
MLLIELAKRLGVATLGMLDELLFRHLDRWRGHVGSILSNG